EGFLKPSTFLNFGKDYTGVPARLTGYVYFYGVKEGRDKEAFLGRVPADKILDRSAYQFLSGVAGNNRATWSFDVDKMRPAFVDPNGMGDLLEVTYNAKLKRYLLSCYHKGPGQLGIFDAPEPWGPWTTVAYYENWGDMGTEGEGLTCSFPSKWISPDGLTMWC